MPFANFRNWRPDGDPFGLYYSPQSFAEAACLRDLAVGCRLIYRSKTNWRWAVVSRKGDEKATLIVCSPTGRTYRLSRHLHSRIVVDGWIPVLWYEEGEDWRENFEDYDRRL